MSTETTRLLANIAGFFIVFQVVAQELPPNAQSLRKSYELAIERATTPITAKYLSELEKLKQQATRVNDVASITAITDEIERVTATSQKAVNAADDIKDKLVKGVWVGTSNGLNRWTLVFETAGGIKMTKPDGSSGWDGWSWVLDDNNVLHISVPGTGQKMVELSKRVDQITFDWGNWGTLARRNSK